MTVWTSDAIFGYPRPSKIGFHRQCRKASSKLRDASPKDAGSKMLTRFVRSLIRAERAAGSTDCNPSALGLFNIDAASVGA